MSAFGNRFDSHSQTERSVAIGRAALASLSLLAATLDPSQPARYSHLTYSLFVWYTACALILLGLLAVLRKLPRRWPIATQIFDLGAFLVFMFYTHGPNSPFVVYFTFSLVCATLRWHWRGALWTGAAAVSTYLLMAFLAPRFWKPDFDLNTFVVSSAQLVVVGGLLGYLGFQEERSSLERRSLAAWPRRETVEARTLVAEFLEHSAAILGAPRILMIWEQPTENRMHVAWRAGGRFEMSEEPLSAFGAAVARPLADSSFLCANAAEENARVIWRSASGTGESALAPLDAGLQARFAIGPVLSWTVRGETIEGRLFALDKTGMTAEDLVLGEIVAGLTAARMDLFALREQLRDAAATEERIRLSRDLHDGVLQSLTGIALQLQASRRLLEEDPQAARERLGDIQASIAEEQRDLRAVVDRLRPDPLVRAPRWTLRLRLEEVCNRIERQWGVRIYLATEGLQGELPVPLPDDVLRIVHEALVNAARHAKASVLMVNVVSCPRDVRIIVEDDGHGFSFQGTLDLATLQQMKLGPITLRERIASLRGSLVIFSSGSGSRLEISLPLPGEATA